MKIEFRQGDVVYDAIFGKGEVVSTSPDAPYAAASTPIVVALENGSVCSYSEEGKLLNAQNRSLFFSEPCISGKLNRPWDRITVDDGKYIVEYRSNGTTYLCQVLEETETEIIGNVPGYSSKQRFHKSLVNVYNFGDKIHG